jgi:hypothetical protein
MMRSQTRGSYEGHLASAQRAVRQAATAAEKVAGLDDQMILAELQSKLYELMDRSLKGGGKLRTRPPRATVRNSRPGDNVPF